MEHHDICTQVVSRGTYENTLQHHQAHIPALNTYLDRLLWWNKRVNLVSRNVSRETVKNHLYHSLILSELELFRSSDLIVDAGTGGGLPGLPLAITHPQKKIILNDIVTKKCLAMKQMIRTLGLKNAQTIDQTIEKTEQKESFLLVSKHAFKINDLFNMTSHLPWTAMALYKGVHFQEELKDITHPLSVNSYELSGISDFYKDKAIVIIKRK